MSFTLLLVVSLLFGIGFGYFAQRGGLCFAVGLGEIFAGRGKRILRFFLLIFVITSVGFVISRFINPSLGLKAVGQIRGYGFYNLLAGMIFGAGIFLNGGCILGTLRQIGEGSLVFVVVFLSMIPGMALVVYVLNPILKEGYHTEMPLLTNVFSGPDWLITAVLAAAALAGLHALRRSKERK